MSRRDLRKVFVSVTTALAGTLMLVAAQTERAAAQEYRIGVDDVLAISVWDNKDVDQVVFVRPDGKISLPLAGEIHVEGVTVAKLESELSELYRRTIKGARVTVVVREIRSRPIFFIGGVGRPGPMQLTQELTLLQAVSLAGGPVPGADLEAAFVLRNGSVIPVNFTKLIQRADTTQNIKLQPHDTIVVPLADVVYIQGEIKTPSAVKFTQDLTMLKAIAQAGGFTNVAASGRVGLVRGDGIKRENIKVNVDDMMKGTVPDMPLKPNDIIIVPQRLF
ncbi:MAG: polysaccharide biosynthesis/export family protein [Candidatus Rokubacteria bacterium]|nr:polysaccharide biosynthesis/export family protein [Candidatus Rokubacteria bacterium]